MGLRNRYDKYSEATVVALALLALYLISLESYLLFHSIVEVASIIVIAAVFLIAWNSRKYLKNSYLLFLGISFFFVSWIDFLHIISYKGMGIFPDNSANLPTQLWIAARYMQSISLLIAPVLMGKEINYKKVLIAYFAVTSLIISIIFMGYFPDCYIDGSGLTQFKVISEYIISLILLVSAILLHKHKDEFDNRVYSLIMISIVLTIFAELAFTFYIDVYDFSNLVGHYFKLLSFYLIYKAIVVTSLSRPYDLLYRELKMREYDLIKKKKAQEDLLEALGLVNQILRHDILNDLNIISLSIENLKGRMSEKELDFSDKAVNHSIKLIREMKDFESLMYIRELVTVDLRILVTEVSQEFPVKVNIHGYCSVKADSGLHSVIGNIIQNAVVHGKAEIINVSMESKEDYCELRISDNGSGIPDKIKGRVFDEGFKYGKSGHTGLGLYITKRIVERYGDISVEDNHPSGTTFIIRFYNIETGIEDKE
ncbi:signal transduction histidine kinase [Methanolobus tindarius DSM 2278]|uniref:Signal transduction histidine kinase n=1 Tax=Methanolobus tindarius DSM 2278 TaxID=1090322 RepID=W9DYH4_METTI|nr:MASE3 domain-containing protein [Methanolobus tindarius]ETA68757.1 signal transduction histidine kinase [Methanolobus tindarius DSM 2278]